MTQMEAPADVSWATFERVGGNPRHRQTVDIVGDLIGCSCCTSKRPCRSMRKLRAELAAESARKDALLALRGEDIEWLLANGWDGR